MFNRPDALCHTAGRFQHYVAFGLVIRSEIALPDLAAATADDPVVDVTISFGAVPVPVGRHHRWHGDADFILAVPPARYHVRGGKEIIVEPSPEGTPGDVAIFLLGSVMAALCLQRGAWAIHANALNRSCQLASRCSTAPACAMRRS